MVAKLYDNRSRRNILNKNITQVGSDLTVQIKENTSIINPTIILKPDTNSLQFNYVYLEDFRRYYYVTNITASQQRFFVDLEVDPLMSFANEIMLCDCILDRQTFKENYDAYQTDDLLPKRVYDKVDTNTSDVTNKLNSATYILAVNGG